MADRLDPEDLLLDAVSRAGGPEPDPSTLLTVEDLKNLPERDRLIVLATFWGGISLRAIARMLRLSDRETRRAIDRSRLTLRGLVLSRLSEDGAATATVS